MSRTYRKAHKPVQFCNKCHKPVWQRTIECYELCECESDRYYWRVKETGAYYRKNMKCPVGEDPWPRRTNPGTQKDCQKFLNRKMRAKTKQELTNHNKPFKEMVFPVFKKGVLWELY